MSTKREILKKYGETFNIIKYVEREMRTFAEKPFSDEDSLVLAQACYMEFDNAVPSVEIKMGGKSFAEIYKAELFPGIFDNIQMKENNFALFSALCRSPRFRDVKINHPVEITNSKIEEQFSATAFVLPGGDIYIGYRGTDASIVGWKEDFYMLIEPAIQSQYAALEYLESIAAISDGEIMLGGHSKGGTLALYRASCCSEKTRRRITAVYNHDGPGLAGAIRESSEYNSVKPLVKTTIPQQSLIGIIMNDGDYSVVYSDAKGIFQHDPYTWQMSDDGFVWADKISKTSDKMENALDEMLSELSEDEKKLAVETVFRVIESTGETNFPDWPQSALKEYEKIIATIKEIDGDTVKKISNTVMTMIKIVFRNMIDVEMPSPAATLENAFANIKNQFSKIGKSENGEENSDNCR